MQPIDEGLLTTPAQGTEREAEAVAEIETGEADATDTGASPVEQPFQPRHIFISHKCNVEPDEAMALMLYADLSGMGHNVYLDKAQPLGVRYEDALDDSLKRADFVIALLTKHTNESDWVKFELYYAHEQFQQHGRPTIIPVMLGLTEKECAMRIRAIVGGFNAGSYDPGDYAEILAQVKAGILNEPILRESSGGGIEGFLVGEFRRKLIRAACLDSPALRRASESLQNENLFWVVGDDSVRNHFARSLAVNEHDRTTASGKSVGRNIYEVPRSLNWSKVNDTLVRNSIIVFPDVISTPLFDEDGRRDELQSLMALAKRNLIIVTVSEESYSEIMREMRNRDLEGSAHLSLAQNFYDERAKQEIFKGLLDFSYASGDITRRKHQWAQKLLEDTEGREVFRTVINKWTPADIQRFVTQHLRQAKGQGDIIKLLQRNADLDNEIHSWFVALDDSTRCFVLALAMLSGLRKEQFWEMYKLLIQRLKKLDQGLSLWPLGICRQRAAPYVTTEGQLDFVDERIAEAIYGEVTKNFREYLTELIPLMKEVSVPPGREQRITKEALDTRRLEALESKELRTGLARVIGKAGRQGLEDLTELLEYWAADPALPIREAVALSLEQAVLDMTGAKHALDLLEKWCGYAYTNSNETLYRMWAAASALGSIVAATSPGTDPRERAFYLLERLVFAPHASIRFYVSISLKKVARKVPLVEHETTGSLAALLSLVAQDEKASTKINIAEALIEARVAREREALGLIREWASSEDVHRRWVAICSLFLWRKQKNEERNRAVAEFLAQDALTTASVLVEILNRKHQNMPGFWQGFKQLILETDDATRRALVSGLAGLPQASLDKSLLPMLRNSSDPALSSLSIEVRAERWRQMFLTPSEFIADLHREVHRKQVTSEVYTALAVLLKPEPEGSRKELVQVLVTCFVERERSLEEVMQKLESIAPAVCEPLSVEIRREGFRRLFYTPSTLIEVIAEGLSSAQLSGVTCQALELLAQREPRGARQEMLQALAQAQSNNDRAVRALMRQLREAGSGTLSDLVYEFNLRSLEGELAKSKQWLTRVTGALRDVHERAEMLQILRQLSVPEPEGRRSALLHFLGAARVKRPAEVDALLQERAWQSNDGLISMSVEVKLFSLLCKFFSPGFASKIFPRSLSLTGRHRA